MNRITSFLISFIIICSSSFAQPIRLHNDPCSKKLYINSGLWQWYPDSLFADAIEHYIKNEFPDQLVMITRDKNSLNSIQNTICLENEMDFKGNIDKRIKINIRIDLTKVNVALDMKKIIEDDYLVLSAVLRDSLGFDYYGFVPEEPNTIIKRIKSIKLDISDKSYSIPPDLFSDLLNPNTCFHFGSLKPIEVYFSKSKNSIYVYVTGNFPVDPDWPFDHQDGYESYLAKFIIPLNDPNKISRIVIPGGFLISYGWYDCPDFWAF